LCCPGRALNGIDRVAQTAYQIAVGSVVQKQVPYALRRVAQNLAHVPEQDMAAREIGYRQGVEGNAHQATFR
jgi:hypothetical protein